MINPVVDKQVFHKLADKYGMQNMHLAIGLVEVYDNADTAYNLCAERKQPVIAHIIHTLFFTPSYERPQI